MRPYSVSRTSSVDNPAGSWLTVMMVVVEVMIFGGDDDDDADETRHGSSSPSLLFVLLSYDVTFNCLFCCSCILAKCRVVAVLAARMNSS